MLVVKEALTFLRKNQRLKSKEINSLRAVFCFDSYVWKVSGFKLIGLAVWTGWVSLDSLVDILSLFYILGFEKADELPTFQGFMI